MNTVTANRLALSALATLVTLALAATAAAAQDATPPTVEPTDMKPVGAGLIAIGAGLAVGLAGIGTGRGEADIGAAAVGAMAEDPKFFGKGLIMTVIPETVVIFGLVIAILLWLNMGTLLGA